MDSGSGALSARAGTHAVREVIITGSGPVRCTAVLYTPAPTSSSSSLAAPPSSAAP